MKKNVRIFYLNGYGEEFFWGSYSTLDEAKTEVLNESCEEHFLEGGIFEIHTEDFTGRWVSTDGKTWNWVEGWDR